MKLILLVPLASLALLAPSAQVIARALPSSRARAASTSTASAPVSAVPKAQYGPWRSCRIGGGGYVQNVISTRNPRVFYAYIDVGGLYRSDDGGRSWKMLHGSLPAKISSYQVRGMSADPRDENNVLALAGSQWESGGGVWASRDGGKSWKLTLQVPFMGNGDDRWTGVLVARDATNPARVLIASEGAGLWQSLDGGGTWSQIAQPDLLGLHPTDLKLSADGQRAWLCARPYKGWMGGKEGELRGGFFASQDGGKSWRKLAEEAPVELSVSPWDGSLLGIFEQKYLRLSRDRGTTWSEFGQGLPQLKAGEQPSMLDERSFQALASGPDFWVTASNKGTFYRRGKEDNAWSLIERQGVAENYEGEPWHARMGEGGEHFGRALASIVIDPRDSKSWFFTDWYAIYHSPDAGRNWNLSMDGLEDTVLHTLAQDASDAGVVHLGMADNGYLWSDNGGVRFGSPHRQSNMKGIAISPAQPNRVYGVGDPGNGQWKSNTVWVSIDRGHSWQAAPSKGLPDPDKFNRNSIAVDSSNALRAYVSMSGEVREGEGGVYQSDDGGATWKWIGQGLPASKYFTSDIWGIGRELAVATDGTLVAASRDMGAVYFRRPNAERWEKSATDIGGPWCVFASPAGGVWAACAGRGVWRSADGGATWAQKSRADARDVSVDLAHPNRVALGCADGVLLSLDGGATWSQTSPQLPHKNYPLVAFAGERLLAGTSGSGAFWMPLSPRGEQPVQARPIVLAVLPGERAATVSLSNADMESGAATPEGWGLWLGEGQVLASRDTATFHGGKSSLRLEAHGGYGSVSQVLAGALGVWGGRVRVRGWVRAEPLAGGKIDESLLALRGANAAGEQSEWQTLMGLSGLKPGEWSFFDNTLALVPSTQAATLTLTLRGSGRVWLDDVSVEAAPSVFPSQSTQ